jgi:hypothetical protein
MAQQLIHNPRHLLGPQFTHHIVVILERLGMVLPTAQITLSILESMICTVRSQSLFLLLPSPRSSGLLSHYQPTSLERPDGIKETEALVLHELARLQF